jgi:uncharacterized protein (UPF0332 family)
MNQEVRDRLRKAAGCLRDAEVLLAAARCSAVVARTYYAMFHAVKAVLIHRAIERSSHHAVIAAFGKLIAKERIVDPRFQKYLCDAFDLRNESDYDAVEDTSREVAEGEIHRAREFVEVCRKLCGTEQDYPT